MLGYTDVRALVLDIVRLRRPVGRALIWPATKLEKALRPAAPAPGSTPSDPRVAVIDGVRWRAVGHNYLTGFKLEATCPEHLVPLSALGHIVEGKVGDLHPDYSLGDGRNDLWCVGTASTPGHVIKVVPPQQFRTLQHRARGVLEGQMNRSR